LRTRLKDHIILKNGRAQNLGAGQFDSSPETSFETLKADLILMENRLGAESITFGDLTLSSCADTLLFITDATAQTITALNHSNKMREPEILFIYPGAVMEFNHNWLNQYSQGQLCISTVLPTPAALHAENATIVVLAAPVGTKVA